jgi:hypothetical protein
MRGLPLLLAPDPAGKRTGAASEGDSMQAKVEVKFLARRREGRMKRKGGKTEEAYEQR